jgi:putative sigma-54 modulation protein
MKISLIASNLDITPSLKAYVEERLGVLKKLVKHFDEEGVAELRVELARSTKHHKKGLVFRAEANLRLPKKVLRAEDINTDIRSAIDMVENKLRREIEKYKTQHETKRGGRKK